MRLHYVLAMLELNLTQAVPLVRDKDGVWRVTGSRVTLDSIVHQFKHGATAEQIQEDFPSVALRDIYAVIAHYLQQTRAVEDYLCEQARAAGETRREVESSLETKDLGERLGHRRAQATA
jgi:uncharacterized protein (DUF433 family)